LGVLPVDKLSNPPIALSDQTINAIATYRPYFAAFLNTTGKEAFHLFWQTCTKLFSHGVKSKMEKRTRVKVN
jgi:hypothetical protein